MSLFTEASLVMIPSGVKDGKLYSIKPDDGVGDFTFTRGSNLAATRVDENGLIEKGRENLLLHSNDFSNAVWVRTSLINIDFSGTDPLGGSTAMYAESNGNAYIYQDVATSTGSLYTWSFYGKSNTTTEIAIRYDAVSTPITLTTEWQRFQVFFTASSTTTRLWIGAGLSWTAGEIAHVAFPQLEVGLVATDYIETGATSEQAGILENLPRLDYTDSSCPSLLLEPTRTNLVTQSEYFGTWTGGSTYTTANYAISPQGVQNATRVLFTGASQLLSLNTSLSVGVSATASVYVKGIAGETILFAAGGADKQFTFTGEWERLVNTSTSVNTSIRFSTYSGVTARDFLIYGAQLEAGSYPTSYIPTYGTSVTRSVDSCSVSSGASGILPQGEGTIYVEGTINDAVNTEGYLIRIDETSYNNTIFISRTSTGHLLAAYRNNSVSIFSFQKNDVPDTFKAALSFESGNSVLYVNGEQIGTSSVTYTPAITYDDVRIGGFNASTANMSGLIKKQIIFKSRLSNTELIALTTI